jgi:hypothetical protein
MKFVKLLTVVFLVLTAQANAVWNTFVTVTGTSSMSAATNFKGQAVTAFKAGQTEVNWTEFQTQRTFANSNGFDLQLSGSGNSATAPVETLNWYDALKWCNAATLNQGTLTPVYYTTSLSIGSLTSTGTVATAIVPLGHQLSTGNWVQVAGATPTGYNLVRTVTVTSPTVFTYKTVVSGTATATGTLTAKVIYQTGDVIPLVDASATGYRLPTEKEWEWAAFGGVSSGTYTYPGSNTSTAVAWSKDNLTNGQGAQPVGGKTANELSIYDMGGNAMEWCFDDAVPLYGRRVRGGCWLQDGASQRTMIRGYSNPSRQEAGFGFRVFTN